MARPTNKLSVKFTTKNRILSLGSMATAERRYLYSVSNSQNQAFGCSGMAMAGRARKMGLGDFELVSLKDARKKRDAAYSLVVDGVDPIDERKDRKTDSGGRDRPSGADVQGMRRTIYQGT